MSDHWQDLLRERLGREPGPSEDVYLEVENDPSGTSLCLYVDKARLGVYGWDRNGDEVGASPPLTANERARLGAVFADAPAIESLRVPAGGAVSGGVDVVVAHGGKLVHAERVTSLDTRGVFRAWQRRLWEIVRPVLPVDSSLHGSKVFVLTRS